MELLWIFLLLFNAYVTNCNKEECSRECVMFNVPYILCAPDVSKVSLSPYYEFASIPQFKNLISKDSAVPVDHPIAQGEFCRPLEPKPCDETRKPVQSNNLGYIDPNLILPMTANPNAINTHKEENTPQIITEVKNQPTKVGGSDLCPVHQLQPKPLSPYNDPPKVACLPRECHKHSLQNAPTSNTVYPDYGCGYYPPLCVNPRYLFQLSSLHNQPPKHKEHAPVHQNHFILTNQGDFGQRTSTRYNHNTHSASLDLGLSPENNYGSSSSTGQGKNGFSNVPDKQPQYLYNKNPKDQFLIPVATENDEGPAPIYVDPNFMYKFCGAYPHPPKTEHHSTEHHSHHDDKPHQHSHQHKPPSNHHHKKVEHSVPSIKTPRSNPFDTEKVHIDFTKYALDSSLNSPDAEYENHSEDGEVSTSNDGISKSQGGQAHREHEEGAIVEETLQIPSVTHEVTVSEESKNKKDDRW